MCNGYKSKNRPDKKQDAMCFSCGSVNGLKKCAKCKSAYYCSAECQVGNFWEKVKILNRKRIGRCIKKCVKLLISC